MYRENGRWTCRTCQRAFLSYRALQRHYDANPAHSDATLDVRDVEPDRKGSGSGSEWIEFDDRVETFLTLSEEIEEHEITVAYHPDDERIEISGAHEETIDTSSFADVIEGEVTWQVSGCYLLLSFPT